MSRPIQVLSPDQARQAICDVSQVNSPGGTARIVGRILDGSRLSPPAMPSRLDFDPRGLGHCLDRRRPAPRPFGGAGTGARREYAGCFW